MRAVSAGLAARDARRAVRAALAVKGYELESFGFVIPMDQDASAAAHDLAWGMGADEQTLLGAPERMTLATGPGVIAKQSFALDNCGDGAVPAKADPLISGDMPDAPGALGGAIPAGLFALLDGARVPNLIERVEGEGLEAACLFQGKATETYGPFAPWLVRLTPGSTLLQDYFAEETGDEIGRCLWRREAGVLLRSTASLSTLRSHFRKYVALLDPSSGKRVFFRFWAPETLRSLVANMAATDQAKFLHGIALMAGPDGAGGLFVMGEDAVINGAAS